MSFDTVDEIVVAYKERRYMEVIRPDELKFFDLEACSLSIVQERVMWGEGASS